MQHSLNDEYYLKKNSGPQAEQCHTRNRLSDRILNHLPIYYKLMKMYHTNPANSVFSRRKQLELEYSILDDDFEPFVSYSLNKKARWRLISSIGPDMLKQIQDENGGLETIFLERQILDYYGAWVLRRATSYQNIVHAFKCKTSHKLKNDHLFDSSSYEKRTIKGKGQFYSSFSNLQEEDKTKSSHDSKNGGEPIVCYNIVKAPKNFKTLFDKDCTRERGYGYPEFLKYDLDSKTWWILHELRNSSLDFGSDIFDLCENDYEDEAIQTNANKKFYKLEEHFVSKPKPKHRGSRNCVIFT